MTVSLPDVSCLRYSVVLDERLVIKVVVLKVRRVVYLVQLVGHADLRLS